MSESESSVDNGVNVEHLVGSDEKATEKISSIRSGILTCFVPEAGSHR